MAYRHETISNYGNSVDKLLHPESDAYSTEQVLPNKQEIWWTYNNHCLITQKNDKVLNLQKSTIFREKRQKLTGSNNEPATWLWENGT